MSGRGTKRFETLEVRLASRMAGTHSFSKGSRNTRDDGEADGMPRVTFAT